jgi:hypothetical protein
VKIEISDMKPDNFTERWPGEFRIFSHFEMALGIETVGRQWATPLLEWFRQTDSIGDLVPTNYYFVNIL